MYSANEILEADVYGEEEEGGPVGAYEEEAIPYDDGTGDGQDMGYYDDVPNQTMNSGVDGGGGGGATYTEESGFDGGRPIMTNGPGPGSAGVIDPRGDHRINRERHLMENAHNRGLLTEEVIQGIFDKYLIPELAKGKNANMFLHELTYPCIYSTNPNQTFARVTLAYVYVSTQKFQRTLQSLLEGWNSECQWDNLTKDLEGTGGAGVPVVTLTLDEACIDALIERYAPHASQKAQRQPGGRRPLVRHSKWRTFARGCTLGSGFRRCVIWLCITMVLLGLVYALDIEKADAKANAMSFKYTGNAIKFAVYCATLGMVKL